MEAQLRELIGVELRRRHALGLMEGKIKPVHIANALMREEHKVIGKMADLKHLMTATADKETSESRYEALKSLLERSRDRWGRLGEEEDLKKSVLMTKVLPLLRTILGTDGAAFGSGGSAGFWSFSSPSALTVTGDPSDDHAGAVLHRLWNGTQAGDRLKILDQLRRITDPKQGLSAVDDLTAVLAPLTEDPRPITLAEYVAQDLKERPLHEIELGMRAAAVDLAKYEDELRANPIATLQRIMVLASITLFYFAATRAHIWSGLPHRPLLLDAWVGNRHSAVSVASERTVKGLLDDGRTYMSLALTQLLNEQDPDWPTNPEETLNALFDSRLKKAKPANFKQLHDLIEEIEADELDIHDHLPAHLVELIDKSGRGLNGYLRLLGMRAGLLYPQQKNPTKRLIPTDRTMEVLVASTIDVTARPVEYEDFLDCLYKRWRIVVGGRLEDATILADAGINVPTSELTENAERLLTRLEMLGFARKMADSVAVVGLMEGEHGHH